jgi:hypothetical protein
MSAKTSTELAQRWQAQEVRKTADSYASIALTTQCPEYYYENAAWRYGRAAFYYEREAAQWEALSEKEVVQANKNALLMYQTQALIADMIKDWSMSQNAYELAEILCNILGNPSGAKAMHSKAEASEKKKLLRTEA